MGMSIRRIDRFRAADHHDSASRRQKMNVGKAWRDHLNTKLPTRSDYVRETEGPAYDANKAGGRGDAYRHYITARLFARMLSARLTIWNHDIEIDATDLVTAFGDLFEDPISDPNNARMDSNNNAAGARDGAAERGDDSWENRTLDFMNRLAKGELRIIDQKTGKDRPGRPSDLYSEPWERPYTPDIDRSFKDPTIENDTIIA